MTDQSEPKEPLSDDDRIVWGAPICVPLTAWDLKQIVDWKGNEWLRDYLYPDERALRERKRGPRPPVRKCYADSVQSYTDCWLDAFQTAVEWCDSGESDEIAKLHNMVETRDKARAFLERDHRRLDDEIAKLRAELDEAQRRQAEATEELRTWRIACQERNGEVAYLIVERDAEKARADRAERELDDLRSDRWKLMERAVAAEDAIASHDARRICRHVVEQLTADLTRANTRIAELEGKASECDNARAVAGLSDCTVALDQWVSDACDDRDSLTRELAEAREEHARNRAEWVATCEAAQAASERYLAERDEAREELRQRDEGSLREGQLWKDIDALAEKVRDRLGPDAHRAKPSPQSPSGWELDECDGPDCSYPDGCVRCNPDLVPVSAPPYETAQTGSPRVVRVDSAPATDDDLPRVGDVVRIDEVHRNSDEAGKFREGTIRTVKEMWGCAPYFDNFLVLTFEDGMQCACRVTIIRRAAPQFTTSSGETATATPVDSSTLADKLNELTVRVEWLEARGKK